MSAINPLDEVAIRCNTDKSSLVLGYTRWYYEAFSKLRDQKVKLLEIGVCEGASLRMWEEFFPYGEIYGIEKDPALSGNSGSRSQIFIGSQADEGFLREVVRETGPLDIIIDDGSHHPEHQRVSLNALFAHLNESGCYVIEDLASSFSPRFGPHAGLFNPGNTIEYLKGLLDIMHGDAESGGIVGDAISSRIEAMHCYPQIVFMYKGPAGERRPAGVADLRSQRRSSPLSAIRSPRARLRVGWYGLSKFLRRLTLKVWARMTGRKIELPRS